jgi:hypothetical protein
MLLLARRHVGMYGEGRFVAAKPASVFTGVNLAMAKSAAGQSLDLINIMAYGESSMLSACYDR